MDKNQDNQPKPGITLSDGRLAAIADIKGKHIRLARRLSAETGHDYMFALVAQTTTINGTGIVPEDLDEMPGPDVLKLMEAVQGNL